MQKDEKTLSYYARTVWGYLQVIIVAFIIVFGFIRPFVVEAFKIPSGSMEDTLLIGDRILVSKFIYGIKVPGIKHPLFDFHKPQRGDVIVFIPPHDRKRNFIKRVVGVAGDTIETRNRGRTLYVNGIPVKDDKYVKHTRYVPDFRAYKVPEGHLFAMGDNRDNSQDSRYWGPVDLNDVKGQAFMIYWSYDANNSRWNIFKNIRFGRLLNIIHSQKIP
ncbi:MAG: signal peptidase I [Candidatus Poribacteria bacterium]